MTDEGKDLTDKELTTYVERMVERNVEAIMGGDGVVCCVLVVGVRLESGDVEMSSHVGARGPAAAEALAFAMRVIAGDIEKSPPHEIKGGGINSGGGSG